MNWINVNDRLPEDVPGGKTVRTNADRIRSMSDEKLLERLVAFCDCSYSCSGCLIEHECPVDDDKDTTVREDIENWLKAPCKEEIEKALEEANE